MKKAHYPDLNVVQKLEKEALDKARKELLREGIEYPSFQKYDDWIAFYEAVRAYSDRESTLVTKYKQPPPIIVPCETSNKPLTHWMDNR